MKTVYIPKGETVHYESLVTDRLVVKGCLTATYGVKAKHISGNGVICAGTVSADTIRVDELEATSVFCGKLLAKRVEAIEVFATDSAAVSCFLSSAYVETGKLTVAASEIDVISAEEVVNLTPKKRGLFRTLLLSALRSFLTGLFLPAVHSKAIDAEYEKVEQMPAQKAEDAEPVDEELEQIIGLYRSLRDRGYTLKIVPSVQEAPTQVFNLVNEESISSAA